MGAESIRAELVCGKRSCPCGRGGSQTHCPAHADGSPSLSVTEQADKVLVYCHAGCTQQQVVEALRQRGLWATAEGRGRGEASSGLGSSTRTGMTLEALAKAKRLPPEHLKACGWTQIYREGAPALRIPYRDAAGEEVSVRHRIALEGDRFRWKKGAKPLMYGLDRLGEAREAGYVLVVEGESDAVTAWLHGVPCVGVPGATAFKEERDAAHLEDLDLYVVQEPGDAGAAFVRSIGDSRLGGRVRVVHLDGFKDLSALHVDNPERFRERLEAAIAAAQEWTALRAEEVAAEVCELERAAGGLLTAPDVLERVRQMITAQGFAGDPHPALLGYVAMTSRLLDRPMNLAFVAPSAAGKNHAVRAAAALLPEEATYILTSGSERALIYDEDDFAYRVIIVEEADAIPDDGPAASAIRAVAEEGALRYATVERDERTGRHHTRHIVKPGPTCLITTSTRAVAHQLGTRLLEVPIPDDAAQTRAVMHLHAARAAGSVPQPPDSGPFIAFQRWLALAARHPVVVPFADVLVDLMPADLVRMRRDSQQLFTCIKAIALLHQRHRSRTAGGEVVADIEDYEHAYGLLAPLFDAIATEGVSRVVRETVAAVRPGEAVDVATLARRLGVSRSTAEYRGRRAVMAGHLVNVEPRGRRRRFALGSPLPEDRPALPHPTKVRELFEVTDGIRENDTPLPPTPAQSSDRHGAGPEGDGQLPLQEAPVGEECAEGDAGGDVAAGGVQPGDAEDPVDEGWDDDVITVEF